MACRDGLVEVSDGFTSETLASNIFVIVHSLSLFRLSIFGGDQMKKDLPNFHTRNIVTTVFKSSFALTLRVVEFH